MQIVSSLSSVLIGIQSVLTVQIPNTGTKVKSLMKYAGFNLISMYALTLPLWNLMRIRNICVQDYIPKALGVITTEAAILSSSLIDKLTPSSLTNSLAYGIVLAPIFEEVQHRLLIQELLLKQIPKLLMHKISFNHAFLVDSSIAKISRVLVSAALFSMSHYVLPEINEINGLDSCESNNQVIYTFLPGLIFSLYQERTGSTLGAVILHSVHNLWIRYR